MIEETYLHRDSVLSRLLIIEDFLFLFKFCLLLLQILFLLSNLTRRSQSSFFDMPFRICSLLSYSRSKLFYFLSNNRGILGGFVYLSRSISCSLLPSVRCILDSSCVNSLSLLVKFYRALVGVKQYYCQNIDIWSRLPVRLKIM